MGWPNFILILMRAGLLSRGIFNNLIEAIGSSNSSGINDSLNAVGLNLGNAV